MASLFGLPRDVLSNLSDTSEIVAEGERQVEKLKVVGGSPLGKYLLIIPLSVECSIFVLLYMVKNVSFVVSIHVKDQSYRILLMTDCFCISVCFNMPF